MAARRVFENSKLQYPQIREVSKLHTVCDGVYTLLGEGITGWCLFKVGQESVCEFQFGIWLHDSNKTPFDSEGQMLKISMSSISCLVSLYNLEPLT